MPFDLHPARIALTSLSTNAEGIDRRCDEVAATASSFDQLAQLLAEGDRIAAEIAGIMEALQTQLNGLRNQLDGVEQSVGPRLAATRFANGPQPDPQLVESLVKPWHHRMGEALYALHTEHPTIRAFNAAQVRAARGGSGPVEDSIQPLHQAGLAEILPASPRTGEALYCLTPAGYKFYTPGQADEAA